ncbi:hypothetical protein ES708_18993 [subsurface metagenome]
MLLITGFSGISVTVTLVVFEVLVQFEAFITST